jgi:hypothetical protein
MVDDVAQIAIGIVLASGYWTFPRWLARVRRDALKRGQLERFDQRFGRVPRALGQYVAPAIGVVLILSGIVFLLQDA